MLAAADDFRAAVLDHEELVTEATLADEALPGLDVDLVRLLGDFCDLFLVQTVEECDSVQMLCVHASILSSVCVVGNPGAQISIRPSRPRISYSPTSGSGAPSPINMKGVGWAITPESPAPCVSPSMRGAVLRVPPTPVYPSRSSEPTLPAMK